MKTRILLTVTALLLIINTSGQKLTLKLTFTAFDSAAYVQLDSIKVMNRTEAGDTVLYYPDTVLVLDYQVGIPEFSNTIESLHVFQNYPNPVAGLTTISVFVPEKDKVSLIVTDMPGRIILKSVRVLDKGTHSFRFIPGSGSLYFFTARWRGESSSIKILQGASNSNGTSSLEYTGSKRSSPQLKATEDVQSFSFNLGDELLYIGYANGLQSGMLDTPETSETHTFQFATNIPCPGTPTVTYEGQVYNTIQIFSQCWLKENLNVGTMILGSHWMFDNGILEKYCYNNEPDSCSKYGGLYQWQETMQYIYQQGTQGICPPGWHIPTDEEWKVLEGSVDSHYKIGDDYWDAYQTRGLDAGANLKTTNGWSSGGNGTDLYGFSGLPGGNRGLDELFYLVGTDGTWWTSTTDSDNDKLRRKLMHSQPGIIRLSVSSHLGSSVRCLKN